jgi:N-acetylmuramoyl-L-alanine amidase
VLETATTFRTRADAVALIDRLAVSSTALNGEEKAQMAAVIAELRTRAFRSFHVTTDAREAIEHYRQAMKSSEEQLACQSELRMTLLELELGGSPQDAYMRLYEAWKKHPGNPCERLQRTSIQDLDAYRPEPAKLAAIDLAVARMKDAPPVGARATADGPVVTPDPKTKTGPSKIVSIEAFGARDAGRVVIHLNHAAMYEVGHISTPTDEAGARIYVDLLRTKRGKAPRTKTVGGLVERVRTGAHKGKTRVVVDLARPAFRRVFFLPEPFRVIIDVTTTRPSAPATSLGKRRVSRVVLDPGHGGSDPGAVGPGGLEEKTVVLDIAHRVAPVLARELGISTMLTRDDDRFVPLEERTARANAFHADLFVSIHCNASESPDNRGVQTYILDVARDDVASRVAARENATSATAGIQLGPVLLNLRIDAIAKASTHFAGLLQHATKASLTERYRDTLDGGVRTAAFFVLLGAEMPSVLFETSFISNPEEESRLALADYRQKLADGIANAIRAYQGGK